MKKKVCTALLALVLCLSQLGSAAMAVGNLPNLESSLSLTAVMSYDGKALPGVNITIHQVAALVLEQSSWHYALTSDFEDSGINISGLTTSTKVRTAAIDFKAYAAEKGLVGKTATTSNSGRAAFSDLEAGLYLIVVGTITNFEPADPSLVAVPGQSAADGSWDYDIETHPKLTPAPPAPDTSTATTTTPPPTRPTRPETETTTPETTTPETTTPEGETTTPDGETTTPDGETTTPGGEITTPEGETTIPDDPDEPIYEFEPGPTPLSPPPAPTNPGNTLVPDGEVYIELDEDGVPLGEWRFDPVEEVWIFDEYPPLSALPNTGMLRWPVQVMAGSGLLFFTAGWITLKGSKEDEEKA